MRLVLRCADNTSYGSCKAAFGCRQSLLFTSGLHSPARDTTRGTWERLTDGQVRYIASAALSDGTRTTLGVSPYITLQLDNEYNDIAGRCRHVLSGASSCLLCMTPIGHPPNHFVRIFIGQLVCLWQRFLSAPHGPHVHMLLHTLLCGCSAGVSIWPYTDTIANLRMGQGLTIWLHTQVRNTFGKTWWHTWHVAMHGATGGSCIVAV